MKKILFLVTVLMLSLTPLISQVTTTTLNTISNFSDFTISGTADSPPFVVTHTATSTSPLSFTLIPGASKIVSNLYTSSTITFDSIVSRFDISSSVPYNYNSQ